MEKNQNEILMAVEDNTGLVNHNQKKTPLPLKNQPIVNTTQINMGTITLFKMANHTPTLFTSYSMRAPTVTIPRPFVPTAEVDKPFKFTGVDYRT